MKSIKEIAEEVGVSKTSIYNLIKRNNIPTERRDGKTLLNEDSVNLIISYYSNEQSITLLDIIAETKEIESESESEIQQNQRLIDILENELKSKDEQLQAKDEQIKAKDNQLNALLILLSKEKDIRLISEIHRKNKTEEPPMGFFKRLFRKRKVSSF